MTTAGSMFVFTPHGVTFAVPATITVPFDPSQVAGGASPRLLKTANGAAGPWEQVAGATVVGNTLRAQVTSFSYVVPVGSPGPDCNVPPAVGTIRLEDSAGVEFPRDPLTGMYSVDTSVLNYTARAIGFARDPDDALTYEFDPYWQGPDDPPNFRDNLATAVVSGSTIAYRAGIGGAYFATYVRVTGCGGTADANIIYSVGIDPQVQLFRTSGHDLQTFRYSSSGFQLIDTDATTPQGGSATVAVAWNGQGNVITTSSVDARSYAFAPTSMAHIYTLNAAGVADEGLASGTGASIAAAGKLVLRAVDVGLETFSLEQGVPARQELGEGTVSATGVAVDLTRGFAVRAHSTGIDVFDVADVAAPTLVGSAPATGGQISSVGVGVKLAAGGSIAVRSGPVGIDVYRIAADGTPSHAGSFVAGVVSSAINTAVDVDRTGPRAVRAHSTGIEVYEIVNPAAPQRIGQRAGGVSTTGVGVYVAGTTAFRATNLGLEAYDISDPASIPAPVSTSTELGVTPAFVGVGLSGGYKDSFPAASGARLAD